MKKINFKNLNVETTIDQFDTFDISKEIGNFIFANTTDIAISDLGKEIYYNGKVEISDEVAKTITDMISASTLLAPIKRAILEKLQKEEDEK